VFLFKFRIGIGLFAEQLAGDRSHDHGRAARHRSGVDGQPSRFGKLLGHGIADAFGGIGGGGEEFLFGAGLVDLADELLLGGHGALEDADLGQVGVVLDDQHAGLVIDVVEERIVIGEQLLEASAGLEEIGTGHLQFARSLARAEPVLWFDQAETVGSDVEADSFGDAGEGAGGVDARFLHQDGERLAGGRRGAEQR